MLIENPLNESSFAFPLLECVHILGSFVGAGTAALMNFRLLGAGIIQSNPAKLWRETLLLTLGGLALAIFSGLLLFSIDPEMYYTNHAFRYKMVALVAAIGFYYTMVRRAAARDGNAPIIASVSLGLWALVPLGGIFIGYD